MKTEIESEAFRATDDSYPGVFPLQSRAEDKPADAPRGKKPGNVSGVSREVSLLGILLRNG